MRRTLFALAAGVVLLAAPLAQAQTAEQTALANEVTELMFDAMDFEGLIVRALEKDTATFFGDLEGRPEWDGFLKDALREEAIHDQPAFRALVAKALARELTVEQLSAGADLLSDPSMQSALAALSGGGQPSIRPSAKAQSIASSPAGSAFLRKMTEIDKLLEPVQVELIAEILPGTLRRFADKVEAGERVRKAAGR